MEETTEPGSVPRPARARRLLRIVAVVAGLGALAVLAAVFGLDDVAQALGGLRPGPLLLYLLAACAVRGAFSLRWYLVARHLGTAPGFGRFAAARLAGDAVGTLIPTGSVGGDPVRIALLYGRGVRGTEAGAGVALDRAMELAGNMICAVAYVSVFFFAQTAGSAAASPWTLVAAMAPLFALMVSLAIPLVLLLRGVRPVSGVFFGKWLLVKTKMRRWADTVRRIEDHLLSVLSERPGVLLWGIVGSLGIEALAVAECHLLLAAFGLDVDLPTVLVMLVTAGLVRVVPVPAALGALEVGQVTLMAAAQGRPDLGFLAGVAMRLADTLWIAAGLAVLSQQGFSLARRPR